MFYYYYCYTGRSEDNSFDMEVFGQAVADPQPDPETDVIDQPLSEIPRASVPTTGSNIENPLPGSSGVVVPSQSKYY